MSRMRTTDVEVIRNAIGDFVIVGLDLHEWVLNPANVALVNDNGDVALFERQWRLPTSVCGHYFFLSRGKQARKAAKEFLKEIFTGPYGIETIIGLTPVENRPALWMNRQLGFKSHGQVSAETGLCEFVLLTKEDWRLGDNT